MSGPQLRKRGIISLDLPEAYLRHLYQLPPDVPVWSRVDAVRPAEAAARRRPERGRRKERLRTGGEL